MNTVSIVIPNHNHYDLLHQLLFDVYKNCSRPFEVIVVDDASTDKEVQNGLDWWAKSGMLPIETISLKKNLGFLRTANKGLQAAEGDIVCLISNDVRVKKDLVEFLSGDYIQSINGLWGGRLLDWDTGWNTFSGKTFPYIEGWILATSRELWSKLDYFDEQFAPNDYEDIDLSAKATYQEIPLCVLPEGYVEHIGAQTIGYGSAREEITKENQKKFAKKWTR